MNSFIVAVGTTLVMLLFSVFFGPFFVDWNGYRGTFESYLSEALGQTVTIEGNLSVQLFPVPRIRVENISVPAFGFGPCREGDVRVSHVHVSFLIMPFLHGEVRIKALDIKDPVLKIFQSRANEPCSPSSDWTFVLPIDADHAVLDSLKIENATIIIGDVEENRQRYSLTSLDLTGSALSLRGPYRSEGTFVFDGRNYKFKLGASKIKSNSVLKTKFFLHSVTDGYSLNGKGKVVLSAVSPSFTGRIGLSKGVAQVRNSSGWRLDANIEAVSDRIVLTSPSLHFASRKRHIDFSGSLSVHLNERVRVEADMMLERLDLNSFFSSFPELRFQTSSFSPSVEQFILRAIRFPDLIDFDFTVENVIFNEGLARNITFGIQGGNERFNVDASLLLGNESHLSLNGLLETEGRVPAFGGTFNIRLARTAGLDDFLDLGTDWNHFITLKPIYTFLDSNGRLRVDDTGVFFDEFIVRLDENRLKGSIALPQGNGRRDLFLDLEADQLDIGRYVELKPDRLAFLSSIISPFFQKINLNFHAISLALGYFDMHDMDFSMTLLDEGGGSPKSDNLKNAKKQLGSFYGSLRTKLRVSEVENVDLISSFPGVVKKSQAAFFAFLDLDAGKGLAALDADFGGHFTLKKISARTNARLISSDTHTSLNLSFKGTPLDVSGAHFTIDLRMHDPDARRLLQRLVVRKKEILTTALPFANLSGNIEISLNGILQTGARLKMILKVPGSVMNAEGVARWGPQEEIFSYEGILSLQGKDMRFFPYLFDLPGKNVPYLLSGSLHTGARIGIREWRFDEIKGNINGNSLTGGLQIDFSQDTTDVYMSGSLGFERINIGELLALLLVSCEMGLSSSSRKWSEKRLDLNHLTGYLGDIEIFAKHINFPYTSSLNTGKLKLSLGPERVELSGIAGLHDRRIEGRMEFSGVREGGVSLYAFLKTEGLSLQEFTNDYKRDDVVPVGILSAVVNLSGKGESWNDLVSYLNGKGELQIREGIVRGVNHDIFGIITDAADAGLPLESASVKKVIEKSFAAGILSYQDINEVFVIDHGVLKVKDMFLRSSDVLMSVTASLDLLRMHLNAEASLRPFEEKLMSEKGAINVKPVITLLFSGPFARPVRSIHIESLIDFLKIRRLGQRSQDPLL